MGSRLRTFCLLIAVMGIRVPAIMAQDSGLSNPGDGFGTINPYNLPQRHWVVAGQVRTMQGGLAPRR